MNNPLRVDGQRSDGIDDDQTLSCVRVRQTCCVTLAHRVQQAAHVEVAQAGQIFGLIKLRRVGLVDLIFVDEQHQIAALQAQADFAVTFRRSVGDRERRREPVAVVQPNSARLDPSFLAL